MRRHGGFTLVEVLVVTGLLATLSVMLYQIFVTGLNADSRSNSESAAYRQAFLTLEQIRRELRGARLDSPTPGETLPTARYRAPAHDRGLVEVGVTGRPTWEPGADLVLTPAGAMVTRRGAQERVLGQLGKQGDVSFRRVSPVLLDITLRALATEGRAESRHDLACRVLLPNQE